MQSRAKHGRIQTPLNMCAEKVENYGSNAKLVGKLTYMTEIEQKLSTFIYKACDYSKYMKDKIIILPNILMHFLVCE